MLLSPKTSGAKTQPRANTALPGHHSQPLCYVIFGSAKLNCFQMENLNENNTTVLHMNNTHTMLAASNTQAVPRPPHTSPTVTHRQRARVHNTCTHAAHSHQCTGAGQWHRGGGASRCRAGHLWPGPAGATVPRACAAYNHPTLLL